MALTLRSITEEAPPSPAQDLEKQLALAAAFTRKHAIASIYHAGSGHPGGALSCADLLTESIRSIFTDGSVSAVFGGENQLF